MAEPEQYDAVVIGSGEGGKYLAWHLAEGGQRVAVVERRCPGGRRRQSRRRRVREQSPLIG